MKKEELIKILADNGFQEEQIKAELEELKQDLIEEEKPQEVEKEEEKVDEEEKMKEIFGI